MTIDVNRRGFLLGAAGAVAVATAARNGIVAPAQAARPTPMYGPAPGVVHAVRDVVSRGG